MADPTSAAVSKQLQFVVGRPLTAVSKQATFVVARPHLGVSKQTMFVVVRAPTVAVSSGPQYFVTFF